MSSLDSILGNLGPKYVDKFELELEELKRRYAVLRKTQGVSKVIKELCISKLKNQIYRTEEIIEMMNDSED